MRDNAAMTRLGLGLRSAPVWAGLAITLGLGCAPRIEQGECSMDAPCPRGQSCDFEVAECLQLDLPTNSTETPAPSTFTNKQVPFYRGEVCLVHDVQAGQPIPVRLNPCLHPCMTLGSFKFKHSWSCVGSSCDAWGALWMNVSGDSCPEDAFGDFARGQCTFPAPVDFTIDANYDEDRPVEGMMRFEVPFLSNADAASTWPLVVDDNNPGAEDTAAIQSKIGQYPEDDGRVPGGKSISLLANNPAPPESCGDEGENCDCFDIGF